MACTCEFADYLKGAAMGDKPKWTIDMRVERNIVVTVEADTEEEARDKAQQWDIVGDEMTGDTLNWKITSVIKDE
jgi:hypothetical protein